MTPFRLAHLSDPHLPPPPLPVRLGDLGSKRLLSRFAWRRKRHRHSRAVLDAIMADIAARAPDHVALTGDLINFATPEEFEAARAWLERLGDPGRLTLSPGNHDALAARGAPPGFAPWAPWLRDGEPGFPHLRVRGPIAIVNLSSAVPTPLHLAQGTLGPDQIAEARTLLEQAAGRGLFRVVLLHHPPVAGAVSRRKRLTDQAALRAMLGQVGAELVLHGHAHAALLNHIAGPRGPIPVLGVPSASAPSDLGHEQAARWNEIAIARQGSGFRAAVTSRGVTPGLKIETLGRYILAT